MKGRDVIKKVIVAEYLRGDVSLRDLGARHGISHSTLSRWVKAETGGFGEGSGERGMDMGDSADQAAEVKRLRKELRAAELHGKLLDAMIEIAEERFQIPIRKKSGPLPFHLPKKL